MASLNDIRREYNWKKLELNELDPNPFDQFTTWMQEAIASKIIDPNAMILATAGKKGKPSARIVLLKDFNINGFTFYTNYESKKGKQLAKNPNASLLFYWNELERQIRIEGKATKLPAEASDVYFESRPKESKISACISPQSQRIPDRKYLDNNQLEYLNTLADKKPERPPNWGGYMLTPNLFEFWQGRENRLHDRFEYALENGKWIIYRLAP